MVGAPAGRPSFTRAIGTAAGRGHARQGGVPLEVTDRRAGVAEIRDAAAAAKAVRTVETAARAAARLSFEVMLVVAQVDRSNYAVVEDVGMRTHAAAT